MLNYGEREYMIATEKWCTISIMQHIRVKRLSKNTGR